VNSPDRSISRISGRMSQARMKVDQNSMCHGSIMVVISSAFSLLLLLISVRDKSMGKSTVPLNPSANDMVASVMVESDVCGDA